MTAHPRLAYRPELDGVRAVAILLVILAHLHFGSQQGGLAGVTVFFVLSGYLITQLLLAERARYGRISVQEFYLRRGARLLPALGLLLVVVVGLGLAGRWAPSWVTGVEASALYLGNWYRAAGIDVSPLGHMWSLAVEEQFYLVWPLLVIVLSRRVWVVATAGVVIALVGRALLPTDVAYFATLTRIDAIFAGCILAIVDVRLPRSVGIAGVAMVLIAALSNEPDAILLPLTTIGSVLLIAGRAPGLSGLAPIGRRAYGLYLWHYPLIVLIGAWPAVPVTFAIAEVSYRLVEQPILSRVRRRQSGRAMSDGIPADAAVSNAATSTIGAVGEFNVAEQAALTRDSE